MGCQEPRGVEVASNIQVYSDVQSHALVVMNRPKYDIISKNNFDTSRLFGQCVFLSLFVCLL